MTDRPSTPAPPLNSILTANHTRVSFAFLAGAIAAVGVAIACSLVTRTLFERAIDAEARARVTHARRTFDLARSARAASAEQMARVLAGDARLRSTLSTEGIDAVTVADILAEIPRSRGPLLVLRPDGRVFAEANAPELRGVDLSSSSVIQRARDATSVTTGSWVVGTRLIDLAVIAIRTDIVVAYLVVGSPVDEALVRSVGEATGATVAIGSGGELAVTSSAGPAERRIAEVVARHRAAQDELAFDGRRYATQFAELDSGAARLFLVLASPVTTADSFRSAFLLLWLPPALVLAALLIARFTTVRLVRRRERRME